MIKNRIDTVKDYFKLNNDELAKTAGVSKQAVGAWLNDNATPSSQAVAELQETLKIDCVWLLKGKGNMLLKKTSNKNVDFSILQIPEGIDIPEEDDILDIESSGAMERAVIEAENKWLKENPQEFRFSIFMGNIDSLKRILAANESNFFDGHLVPKMCYTYAISMMEGYLSDTAIQLIHYDQILLNSLKKYGGEKLTLTEIYHKVDCVRDAVLTKISGTTWHNINHINTLFSTLIGKSFDFSELSNVIKIRHDLVHRDGKTITGEKIYIGNTDFIETVDLISKTVNRLHREIKLMGVN